MAKRPLSKAHENRRRSKRLTPENSTDNIDLNEIFAARLTEKVFGRRATQVEKCGVQYLVDMRVQPQPSLARYLARLETAHPQGKAHFGTTWNRLKQFFSSSKDSAYSDILSLTDVQAFIKAFQAEQFAPEPSTAPKPVVSDLTTALAVTTRSQASKSPMNGSSSGSNSSSSSSLSAGTILRMTLEYEENFASFTGETWMLPSGACVDDVVARHVRTLNKESALHSFIIDRPTTVLNLFPDPADKAALTEILVQCEGESTKLVSAEEEAYIRLYDKEPARINEMLARGWLSISESQEQVPESFCESVHLALHLIYIVYRSCRFQLPEKASESFFVHTLWGFIDALILCDETLLFRPAEVHSQASSFRKNKDRAVEDASRQAVGRKVDGLILSASTLLELCTFEAARRDAGPKGTKALNDTYKMAKVMKDSFDIICGKANADISHQLVVYGVRIAGASLTFYSMRKRRGRFYQMVKDGSVSFPATWDDTTTISILTIVASVMALRQRVSHMAKQLPNGQLCHSSC
ncbi:hypothetical protein EC968_002903 [Mortierella alpina]|nr:hypothetical protein EC968_002903 [Mortierella alpina]